MRDVRHPRPDPEGRMNRHVTALGLAVWLVLLVLGSGLVLLTAAGGELP